MPRFYRHFAAEFKRKLTFFRRIFPAAGAGVVDLGLVRCPDAGLWRSFSQSRCRRKWPATGQRLHAEAHHLVPLPASSSSSAPGTVANDCSACCSQLLSSMDSNSLAPLSIFASLSAPCSDCSCGPAAASALPASAAGWSARCSSSDSSHAGCPFTAPPIRPEFRLQP